jgi:hypothetical protein
MDFRPTAWSKPAQGKRSAALGRMGRVLSTLKGCRSLGEFLHPLRVQDKKASLSQGGAALALG